MSLARIIRTSDSRGPSLGAQRRAIESGSVDILAAEMIAMAEAEAERIVAAGQQQAAAIVKQAQDQAAALVESSRAEHDSLIAQESVRVRELLANFGDAIEAKQSTVGQVNEGGTMELALAIAERIVRQHLEQDSQLAAIATREVLQWVASAAKVTVRLSPADFEQHEAVIVDMLRELHPVADCEVVSDATITLGGTRVDTEFGSIDQTIETQLGRIEEELGNV